MQLARATNARGRKAFSAFRRREKKLRCWPDIYDTYSRHSSFVIGFLALCCPAALAIIPGRLRSHVVPLGFFFFFFSSPHAPNENGREKIRERMPAFCELQLVRKSQCSTNEERTFALNCSVIGQLCSFS